MMNRMLSVFLLLLTVLGAACSGQVDETNAPLATAQPVTAEPTQDDTLPDPTDDAPTTGEDTPTAEDTPVPPVSETTAATETPAPSGEALTYVIDPALSSVRFELNEELRGQPKTVVGSTNAVVGEVTANLADLSTAQMGTIQIDAGTLATDNNFRNRAIREFILRTDSFQFITFEPTAIEGLPENAGSGDEVTFTVAGNLTIRDITLPVTFDVTAIVDSANVLRGVASTTVDRTDFELNIPDVPGVANVEEEVELYIDFVANNSS